MVIYSRKFIWNCQWDINPPPHQASRGALDYSLFTKGSGNEFVALLVYVDDIVITGSNLQVIESLKSFLHSHFKLKDLGNLKYFLGLEIARSHNGIVLSQRQYVLQLLEDTRFLACKHAAMPMDPKVRLSSFEGELLEDSSMYRRLPRKPHLTAIHHLLQYIKATPGQGLLFSADSSLQLRAYADADWGSCPDSRKSITGFCVFLGDSMVSWTAKK
ncbi:uncharacterized protein LOC111371828 [Olea europaea var. sylvestris]|uniref:uncharacterized protein LOC111371828 n=1 Tax=Olea europaea var. sylvestris TaxID=158386 RepID=UPI000C1D097C|nr:uncharacterized protein LOC111371828 [Olea europaea var. sylvestris]